MKPSNTLPGTSIPKLELVRSKPEAAAKMSKAIKAPLQMNFDVGKRETYYNLNQSKIQAISDTQKDRLKENDNIMDLFPDIGMAEQIIVSSILSPKDMFSQNLIYQTRVSLLPSTLQTKVNDLIKEHIETHYDLAEELPHILAEAIFRTGSYVSAVFPEAAVDQIINGRSYSQESDKRYIRELIDEKGNAQSIGILGPATSSGSQLASLENFFSGNYGKSTIGGAVSLESHKDFKFKIVTDIKDNKATYSEEKLFGDGVKFSTEGFLEITDNYQLVKLPKLMDAISKQRIKRSLKAPAYTAKHRLTLESYESDKTELKKLTETEFSNFVYKNAPPTSDQFVMFPNKDQQNRYSVDRPLRIKIPSEAVIPVYPPGDPKNHRGYFVLVDADGNWVTRSGTDTSTQGLQSLINNQNTTNSLTSLMLDKTKRSLSDNQQDTVIDQMLEIYSSIVENDMLSRLKNGVYGTKMELAKDREWERIMLARALAGKMTRLVYMPAELITYYAYDYHDNGVGKSYLDKVKMLTSLRAVLLFSKIMAEMKSAINVTKVDVTIDPEDPDPKKTIEVASHDVLKLREAYFPLGVNNPVDLVQWIQRAGIMMSFKGHPGLPETSFDFSVQNLQHQVPASETQDDLRKQTFSTFGLTPEQIDNSFGPDFATTAIQNNVMFAKRISLLSDTTSKHLSSDVQNICTSDPILRRDLIKVLKESKEEFVKGLSEEDAAKFAEDADRFIYHYLDDIVANIWVDLPKPNMNSIKDHSESFVAYRSFIDEVLNSYFSDEVFSQPIDGEIASHVTELKNFWKHFFLRQWLADEGAVPEIAEIFKRDDDGKASNDVLDVMDKFKKELLLPAAKFIERSKKVKDALDKDLNKLGVEEGTVVAASTSSSSDLSSGSDSGGGDFSFDLGPDLNLDTDTTTTETTETTETGSPEEPGAEEPTSDESLGRQF